MVTSLQREDESMAHVKTRDSHKTANHAKPSTKTMTTATAPVDRVREDVKRRLAVLTTADAPTKLRAAFNATPKELAAAANAAEARRKR